MERPKSAIGTAKSTSPIYQRPSTALGTNGRPRTALSKSLNSQSSSPYEAFFEKKTKKPIIDLVEPDVLKLQNELVSIKKLLNKSEDEKSSLKHQIQKLEISLKKKDRDINEVLTKGAEASSSDNAVTFTTIKNERILIESLKNKLLEAEQTVIERDNSLLELKSTLKYSKINEMNIEIKTLTSEVKRLKHELEGQEGEFSSPLQLKQVRDRLSGLLNENIQLSRDLSESRSIIEVQNKNILTFENELLKKERTKELLESQIQKLQRSTLEHVQSSLSHDLVKLDQPSLIKLLEQAHEQQANKSNELRKCESKISDLKSSFQNAEEALKVCKSDLDKKNSEILLNKKEFEIRENELIKELALCKSENEKIIAELKLVEEKRRLAEVCVKETNENWVVKNQQSFKDLYDKEKVMAKEFSEKSAKLEQKCAKDITERCTEFERKISKEYSEKLESEKNKYLQNITESEINWSKKENAFVAQSNEKWRVALTASESKCDSLLQQIAFLKEDSKVSSLKIADLELKYKSKVDLCSLIESQLISVREEKDKLLFRLNNLHSEDSKTSTDKSAKLNDPKSLIGTYWYNELECDVVIDKHEDKYRANFGNGKELVFSNNNGKVMTNAGELGTVLADGSISWSDSIWKFVSKSVRSVKFENVSDSSATPTGVFNAPPTIIRRSSTKSLSLAQAEEKSGTNTA